MRRPSLVVADYARHDETVALFLDLQPALELLEERFGPDWRETIEVTQIMALTNELKRAARDRTRATLD